MLTSEFDYALPEELIAQKPLAEREQCRLCVVDRASGAVEHRQFDDLPNFLRPGDLLVLNNSRVVKARVPCFKEGSGGSVEIFLLEPPGAVAQSQFKVFFKPARKAVPGAMLRPALAPEAGAFEVLSQGAEEPGVVRWSGAGGLDAAKLEGLGVTPLPPYIKRDRLPALDDRVRDAAFYQSVYARKDGSAAAPTAGLHFSLPLIEKLNHSGIQFAEVTLHVGAGTFLPVKSEKLENHKMHSERYELNDLNGQKIALAKKEGRRVIPVGTTALRVLESAFDPEGGFKPGWAETSIFIRPGDTFKVANALITNFHQPKSTLLALISAFYDKNKILEVYQTCIDKKYRFLSYGDAMFLI